MKKILGIYSGTRQHRIGEGLLARTLFSQRTLGRHVSPFLLLDHVDPTFAATLPAAAGACKSHAYSGCKMLTMVRQGKMEYVDADGNRKIIEAGDVQWMTVAEDGRPGQFQPAGARRNDVVDMLQLWIDLPDSSSPSCPGRLSPEKVIAAKDVPVISLPDGGGRIRVIAGSCENHRGVMPTSSSFDIWELQLKSRCMPELKTVAGRTLLLAILSGSVMINGDQSARSGEVVMLDRPGEGLFLETYANTTALLLSGEPINAPGQTSLSVATTLQA